MKKRTTIYLDETDRAAIAQIKARSGVTSERDAIRLALRQVAQGDQADQTTPEKES